MTFVSASEKSCVIKPLKLSPALGGALALLGIDRTIPLLHGAQGCTAFALVLAVRHFREAIPLQTTAMSELNAILGGTDNLEQAVEAIHGRAQPRLIGICSTALTETRDEDIAGDLRLMRARHPEWENLTLAYASTPDFAGSLETGWAVAVEAVIEAMVPAGDGRRRLRQINLLTGGHLTPADVETLKTTVEGFGLAAIVLPDLSTSLDGHVPDDHVPTTLGGTPPDAIRRMAHSVMTFAIGEHMRSPAQALERRANVPYRVFDTVTGLEPFDAFIAELMAVSGRSAPATLRRQRSRLVDAMLDGHACFAGRRVVLAAEPDLLLALTSFLSGLGCDVMRAVSPCASACLRQVSAREVVVGDFDELEQAVLDTGTTPELIVANAHADAIARLAGVPLFRAGFPIFDRLGAAQRVNVGYDGALTLLFELANLFLEHDAFGCHIRRDCRSRSDGKDIRIDATTSTR